MSQHEAICKQHKAVNGRHYLSFAVDGPGDAPDEFELQPSPLEYERLKDHSGGDSVGRVPVVYEDGWAVDWDAIESASDD
jgi:hypothetical protein